jgi:hypothetical protein
LARQTPDEAAARELLALVVELEIEAGLQAALYYPEVAPQQQGAPPVITADE